MKARHTFVIRPSSERDLQRLEVDLLRGGEIYLTARHCENVAVVRLQPEEARRAGAALLAYALAVEREEADLPPTA